MEEEEGHPKRESTFPLFSKFFGIQPQNVVEYVGTMKKQMEDFIEAFRKRIEVEINYSKSLTQVSKTLDKYIKPGTELASSYISSAFKVQHQQRSRQAMELAESLKTQVQSMCSEMLRKQVAFHKKMEKDVKRFYKEASGLDQNHKQALIRFQGISRQMEEMIITKNIMKYTTGIPQQKKVKLISKTMESIRENKEYEKLYIQAVKSYNYFASAYNEEIKTQLDQAETQVREQMTMQCDSLRKLIVAEVSMFKNIEYDLLNISKQMEYLDTQREVEVYVEENKNSPFNRIIGQEKSEQSSKKGDSFAQFTIQQKKIVGKSMLSSSLLHVDQEYFSWMLFNKKNKRLRDIVSGIWKMLKEEKGLLSASKIGKTQVQANEGDKIKKEEPKIEEAVEQKTEQKIDVQLQAQQVGQAEKALQEDPQEIEGDNMILTEPKQNEQKQSEASNSLLKKIEEKSGQELKNEQKIEQLNQIITSQESLQKKQDPPQQQASVPEVHEWLKELKQLLESFKIQQPPSIMVSKTDRKEKNIPTEIAYAAFLDIMRIISDLWNIDDISSEFVNGKLTELEKYMSQEHLYRLVAFIFLEEYRIQLEVMIKNGNCARVCSKVLRVIIRESQKQNDTFIVRGILGLIFTYYWVDDKFKRLIYLNPEVYQCQIWKKHDFWEAAIFQTTYEEMAMFSKQKGETISETMLREKNIIFSQLASFCHYMVMLGITSKNVRLIVGRYCRLYEMTEEQNKDLSKMISNTTKQFKELSFQFSLKGAQKQKSIISD